jgi:hypothetical protein
MRIAVLYNETIDVDVPDARAARVEASIAFGVFRPVISEQTADGYQPFEDGLGARRIRAGLSWRIR